MPQINEEKAERSSQQVVGWRGTGCYLQMNRLKFEK